VGGGRDVVRDRRPGGAREVATGDLLTVDEGDEAVVPVDPQLQAGDRRGIGNLELPARMSARTVASSPSPYPNPEGPVGHPASLNPTVFQPAGGAAVPLR
jgi:hypothetical protein